MFILRRWCGQSSELQNLIEITVWAIALFFRSSHRWVEWHPDGQDRYSIITSMRLLTVWILFFQVLGGSPSKVWDVADRTGDAPMGSGCRMALPHKLRWDYWGWRRRFLKMGSPCGFDWNSMTKDTSEDVKIKINLSEIVSVRKCLPSGQQ